MSISSITSNINRLEKDIANLEKQKSSEFDKEIRVSKNIDSLTDQANKTKSQSTLKSKLSQIRTKQTELGRIEKKKADFLKKIADKSTQLRKYQIDLTKEQTKERKKTEKEQLNFQRNLNREIERQKQWNSHRIDAIRCGLVRRLRRCIELTNRTCRVHWRPLEGPRLAVLVPNGPYKIQKILPSSSL